MPSSSSPSSSSLVSSYGGEEGPSNRPSEHPPIAAHVIESKGSVIVPGRGQIMIEIPEGDDPDREGAFPKNYKSPYLAGSLRNPETRMYLSWTNVKYTVPMKKQEPKEILKGVSGEARPGEMIAIMGSSGAGKTTLLNTLAGRVATGDITGEILVNSRPRAHNWKRVVGYVEQDDVMYRTLTVRETITFAALLRLPRYFTKEQKKARVEEVINELGLAKCSNTIIGDEETRGISGGERKRVAIGIELVTNPRLLFLDEPTSGLDSFTAFNIIDLIGQVVKKDNRTVIMTIHQPRTDILNLFSKLLLLSQGKTVYYGSVDGALAHFEKLGFKCPALVNPADFFLDIITVDFRNEEARKETQIRVTKFHDVWTESEECDSHRQDEADEIGRSTLPMEAIDPLLDLLPEEERQAHQRKESKKPTKVEWCVPWITEVSILLQRNFINEWRDKQTLYATLGQTIFIALLVGFVFFQIGLDQTGVISRIGVLFFITIQTCFAVIQPITTLFPLERFVILRERYASTYRVSAFYLAKAISILPLRIVATIIFSSIVYYLIGLQPSAKNFFIFQGILLDLAFTAQALGMFVGSVSPNVKLAQIFGPLILVIFLIFGGNLVNNSSVTPILSWIQYLSLIKWSYSALALNELTGLNFYCNDGQAATPSQPCNPGYSNGTQVLMQYELETYSITTCCLILLGLGIGFQFIAYVCLRFTTKPKMKIK